MKMSIRKLVAGSLVCAIAASSTPFLNVSPVDFSKVQAASNQELAPGETELYLQEEAYGSQRNLYGSLWIYEGLGTTLKISSTSNDVKNVTCTFESSDPSVFTIDNDGVITPKSLGDATLIIHAKSEDGQEQTRRQDVKVVDHFVCGDMSYGLVSDDDFIFLEASYASKDITRIMVPYMINEDVIKVIGKESCAGYKNVKLIEVPNTVTTIEDRAFADNDSLEFVMIPESVTEIADNAFGDSKAEDGQDTKKIIIKGYKGTEAEKFAKAHEDIVTFEAIDGKYVPYKYVYSMAFEESDNYKTMETGEECQFSVKTDPEITDENITFTSADESIVSVTSDGAAVAKGPGTTQIIATSTTGVQKKTTVSVFATQETSTPQTPHGDYYAYFKDGDKSWQSRLYPIQAGGSSIQMPEVEEKDGYRFLGWDNGVGLYQPGEWAPMHNLSDSTFVAQWEKIEATTPATGSAVTTSTPTSTPIEETSSPTETPEVLTTPYVTSTPTPEPIVTETPAATSAPLEIVTPVPTDPSSQTPLFYGQFTDGDQTQEVAVYAINGIPHIVMPSAQEKEGYTFAGWSDGYGLYQPGENVKVEDTSSLTFTAKWIPDKSEPEKDTTADTAKDDKVKKASLKIVTKNNKKFTVGKKYTIKAKRTNTSKSLKWSVSNKKIATINEKTGVLKAKKAGKVTITAACGNLKEKITIKIK